jgi:hypothetical protein
MQCDVTKYWSRKEVNCYYKRSWQCNQQRCRWAKFRVIADTLNHFFIDCSIVFTVFERGNICIAWSCKIIDFSHFFGVKPKMPLCVWPGVAKISFPEVGFACTVQIVDEFFLTRRFPFFFCFPEFRLYNFHSILSKQETLLRRLRSKRWILSFYMTKFSLTNQNKFVKNR